MEEPPPVLAQLLERAGLVRIDQSRIYNCLRWSTDTFDGGILYASHMPIPWGAYWKSERGEYEFVWSQDVRSVLLVLHHCRNVS